MLVVRMHILVPLLRPPWLEAPYHHRAAERGAEQSFITLGSFDVVRRAVLKRRDLVALV